jgi:acyl-CoA synthetase (AMP-forming)/AMP-acid ligase II
MKTRIVDEDDQVLTGEGATGDILVRSPALMLGYVNNEKATLEAFDTEGWLRTGDVGQIADGNKIFIVDRKKDLMKVRGWQVSPAEVEGTILHHPDITDAAVIGIELANHTGEIPRAYVVVRPGTQVTAAEVKVFVDRIPKNATGKILRRILREEAVKYSKPEPSAASVKEGKASGPWRYARRVSDPASWASKSLVRLFSWLRSFFLL